MSEHEYVIISNNYCMTAGTSNVFTYVCEKLIIIYESFMYQEQFNLENNE